MPRGPQLSGREPSALGSWVTLCPDPERLPLKPDSPGQMCTERLRFPDALGHRAPASPPVPFSSPLGEPYPSPLGPPSSVTLSSC